jgi:hypothetical protein
MHGLNINGKCMIWEMVRQVRPILVMKSHVRIRRERVMRVMIWNVGEMHFWAEISGQGTSRQWPYIG